MSNGTEPINSRKLQEHRLFSPLVLLLRFDTTCANAFNEIRHSSEGGSLFLNRFVDSRAFHKQFTAVGCFANPRRTEEQKRSRFGRLSFYFVFSTLQQTYIPRLFMHDVNSNSPDGKTRSNRKWKINYIKQQQTLRFNSRIMILLVIIFRLFTSQSLRSFIPFLFCLPLCLWMCLMLHFFVLLNAAIYLQGMP